MCECLCFRVFMKNDNIRTEPKFIVFFTQLLTLFRFCPCCKSDNPLVEVQENGTMAEVTTICSNPSCNSKTSTWHSQPNMPGTTIPAGNFLLCFAILDAGGSASKILQVYQHMGIKCISLTTFFKHQRVSKTYFLYKVLSRSKVELVLHFGNYKITEKTV